MSEGTGAPDAVTDRARSVSGWPSLTEAPPGPGPVVTGDDVDAAASSSHPGRGEVPPGAEGSLAQLLAVVAAIVLICVLTRSTDLLFVVVALIAMVMIHELGHFATAKWSHMKVTEYFLGFGPRLWSVRRGETEYGVKAIPLGGYVKILGMSNTEEVDPVDEPRTYRQQPFHNRLMVALAGSFMHFVMAFVLLWAVVVFIGQPQPNTTVVGLAPVTHGVAPAEKAGIAVGDRIVSIDGRPVTSTVGLQHAIGSHPDVPLTVVVERGQPARSVTLTVTPARGPGLTHDPGRIGISIGSSLVPVSPIHAVGTAGALVGEITSGTIAVLGHTFSPHGLSAFFGQLDNTKAADAAAQSGNRPVSLVGAGRLLDQGAQGGAGDFLGVLATVILAVGIINLVPMLPLDGGHVLVAVYERIRSRRGRPYRADVTKLLPVASAFVLFLVIFVAAAVFLDIAHPIANPFQ